MKDVFVGNIVEENGLTVKENNLKIQHKIPLGTLVELQIEEYEEDEKYLGRMRLYVNEHSRDCDGTPIYRVGMHPNFVRDNIKQRTDFNRLLGIYENPKYLIDSIERSMIFRAFPEESLIIIELPK